LLVEAKALKNNNAMIMGSCGSVSMLDLIITFNLLFSSTFNLLFSIMLVQKGLLIIPKIMLA
jgi:hypothetical protein